MKNIIALFTLLITCLSHAQFTPGELKELTQDQVIIFSNATAANAKTPLEFVEAKQNTKGDYYIVNYGTGESKIKIIFNIYNKGENKALQVPGVKTFRFYQMFGSYLDLFPTWKKVFRPDAELEKTVDDFNSQELINRTDKINFKLKGQDDEWSITNWS